MMGISYGGISQLFTAATQPPSLAAISPLSVIDNTQTTLYPGGILNTGFALEWAKERVHDAEAGGPSTGQAWAYKRDPGRRPDLRRQPGAAPRGGRPAEEDRRKRPLQTRGRRPALAGHLRRQDRRADLHGLPVDRRADRRPLPDPRRAHHRHAAEVVHLHQRHPRRLARPGRPSTAGSTSSSSTSPSGRRSSPRRRSTPRRRWSTRKRWGSRGVTLPPTRSSCSRPTSLAMAAFEDLKPVRVLFDSGAGGLSPGRPYPGFEKSFDRIPGPRHRSQGLVPLAGRRPQRQRAAGSGADEFTWDADALPKTDFSGDTAAGEGGLWTAMPQYHWEQSPPGSAVSYLTAPLGANTTVIGAGAVNLWVRSSTPNVDLQATISEVRPDGKETFVQNGWVRGNERKLDAEKSTPLEPVLSLREADVSPLPRRRIRPGHDPALLRGPRLPRRLADPGHDRRPQRHPADLGLRPCRARRHRPGRDRLRRGHPLEPAAAGRPRGQRADRPAALPRPARASRAAPTRPS